MKNKIKNFGKSFYDAVYWTVMHDGIEHAGYLAFLGLLSFFPFMVFFVAVAGLVGESQVGTQFVSDVISQLPQYLIDVLKPRADEIANGPPQGLLTIAIIGVIWTASSAVEGLRTILNRAYRVQTPPAYIWRRLMSILQFMLLTLALITAMSILLFGPVAWDKIKLYFEVHETFFDTYWHYIRWGISALLLFLTVAVTYYTLPNIKQRWRDVMPGSILVVIFWVFAAEGLAGYISNFEQINLIYGSLGGIIAALLFFYIIGVIYIFGAEFNYFFERSMGIKLKQKEKVTESQKDCCDVKDGTS